MRIYKENYDRLMHLVAVANGAECEHDDDHGDCEHFAQRVSIFAEFYFGISVHAVAVEDCEQSLDANPTLLIGNHRVTVKRPTSDVIRNFSVDALHEYLKKVHAISLLSTKLSQEESFAIGVQMMYRYLLGKRGAFKTPTMTVEHLGEEGTENPKRLDIVNAFSIRHGLDDCVFSVQGIVNEARGTEEYYCRRNDTVVFVGDAAQTINYTLTLAT